MRIFRHYCCDYGHQWVVQRDDFENEQPSDLICPDGHPAINGRVELPVDDVQILISPAARIVDQLKQQRVLDGRLSVSARQGWQGTVRIEGKLRWDAVVKLAAFFRDKSIEQAIAWWAKRNL